MIANELREGMNILVETTTGESSDRITEIHVLSQHSQNPGKLRIVFGSGHDRVYAPTDDVTMVSRDLVRDVARQYRLAAQRTQILLDVLKDLVAADEHVKAGGTMTSLIKRSGLARQTVYEARESLPTLAAKAIVRDGILVGYVRKVPRTSRQDGPADWFAGPITDGVVGEESSTKYASRKQAEAAIIP